MPRPDRRKRAEGLGTTQSKLHKIVQTLPTIDLNLQSQALDSIFTMESCSVAAVFIIFAMREY